MRTVTIAALGFLVLSINAHAQEDPKVCAGMDDAGQRILCYDGIFKESKKSELASPTVNSKWQLSTTKSKIDDSATATLALESDDDFAGKFGGREKATMVIRCQEHATSLYLIIGDHFLADIQGYDEVTYRIDEKKAATKTFGVSTDHKALGLWSGGSSIPFVKQMLGRERLVVRVTPYNESAITATFDISGAEEAVKPVREICKW
jgi:type VI secretion system protein VasI